jgi:aminoglycoside phosphotransferase (APT) family kinase protein
MIGRRFGSLEFSLRFTAFWNVFSIPSEVEASDPWYVLMRRRGRVWKKGSFESDPRRFADVS